MQTVNEEESEMAVSRLLRSASAHFKVVSETNYDALPPICTLLYAYIAFLF